jgi:hypothetical protein
LWRNRITGHAEVAPASLLPNPANWRRHPVRQQRALAGALGEVGWVAQVMVNRTSGHLVDGHLRLELALARGEPTVPVAYVELSEAEERLVLASLDPLAAMADTDRDALALLLAEVTPSDRALTRMLAELADRNGISPAGLGDPDAVPEVPDEADLYVRPGDRWQLGEQRLLCGDATDPGDVTRLLAGEQPTLLVTDPPYGVSLDMEWRDQAGLNRLGRAEPSYLRGEGHRATSISGDTVCASTPAKGLGIEGSDQRFDQVRPARARLTDKNRVRTQRRLEGIEPAEVLDPDMADGRHCTPPGRLSAAGCTDPEAGTSLSGRYRRPTASAAVCGLTSLLHATRTWEASLGSHERVW